jgi:hypothetical protein
MVDLSSFEFGGADNFGEIFEGQWVVFRRHIHLKLQGKPGRIVVNFRQLIVWQDGIADQVK